MREKAMIFRKLRWPLIFLGGLVFISVFADIFANGDPLYCRYKGGNYFPAFSSSQTNTLLANNESQKVKSSQYVKWHALDADLLIWAPIPYGPKTVDQLNKEISPFASQVMLNAQGQKVPINFRWKHHLGTDKHGYDLFAQLIHGSRVSLLVSLLAVFIAAVIGILLGTLAAFWGDDKLKMSLVGIIFLLISLPLAFYYGFSLRQYTLADAAASSLVHFFLSTFIGLLIGISIIALFQFLAKALYWIGIGQRSVHFPFDLLVSRLIELLDSLPSLLLLLTIAAIFEPSVYLLAWVIGFTGWTGVARFVRAEVLQIKELDYIQAGRAMGFPTYRLIFKHIIPHAITPIWIVLAFSIGNVIITEAALAFINIGVAYDIVSWGKLLPDSPLQQWWLALFPGLAIFFTVLAVNIVGEKLRDILDPKM